jgi:hypothetical protein
MPIILTDAARRVIAQWEAWIDDPDHNAPPNDKASAARLREYKRSRRYQSGASSAELELKMTMAGIDLELALLELSRSAAFTEHIQRVDDVLAHVDRTVRMGR